MNRTLRLAAVLGAAGVLAGTFGAHALEHHLSKERLETWETGVRYHFVHALALMLTAAFATTRAMSVARWAFAVGVVLFSGSLYLLATTEEKAIGYVTPVGGVCFLVGWIALWVAAGGASSPAR